MENFNALPQPEQNRIMQAVNKLCANNPDVAKQLEKIVEIKEADGLTWKMLKSKV
jgi:hypothetical protein